MSTTDRDRLRAIKTFPQLVEYLRDELDWPIETDNYEDLHFDYAPEELGLDEEAAAKIKTIKQLRPLATVQPWGIFFIEFEPKRLPVVVLRRILRSLVIKKRASAKRAEQATWHSHDLLFISAYGEGDERQLNFAHFSENPEVGDIPTLRVLGWDSSDTPLHLDHVHHTLTEKLCWPDNGVDLDTWRETWSSAFTLRHREVITTSRQMAIQLAELARDIRQRVNAVLAVESSKGPIRKLMKAFRESLIHDLKEDDFSDMYAQTIAYGLLTARVSRPVGLVAENIHDMVPITNPFLKELLESFLSIGGRKGLIDFDELGISEVVEVLRETNMEAVLHDFGDRNPQEDPVIHFYELFLTEYDKKRKIQRGVFYTPQPVVSYIVRSVHELLQTEFGLADGLADTTTWGEMLKKHQEMKLPPVTDDPDEKRTISPDEPFVQVLDPATGTATFLVEVIDVIYRTLTAKWKKQGLTTTKQSDAWNEYVPKNLLPRLHGYELMMAPYAIAHMKLGLKLTETGFQWPAGFQERANIYLTNALEPWRKNPKFPEFEALAHEAEAVNRIKRDRRFTVVIGNPPYSSAATSTQTEFLADIMRCFTTGLGVENERKKGALQDEYIRFVALSRHIINRTDIGIIGLITNNSYLDGTLHRAMRKSLNEGFPQLGIVNLHGSTRVGARAAKDENVFDIMQGVAIITAVRLNQSSPYKMSSAAEIRYADLFGNRAAKYDAMTTGAIKFTGLSPAPPYYLLRPLDRSYYDEYETLVSISDVFGIFSSGIETEKDYFAVDFEVAPLRDRLREFCDLSVPDKSVAARFDLKSTPNWDMVESRRALAEEELNQDIFTRYLYHCFDWRYTYYSDHLVTRSRRPVMCHMSGDNLALLTLRQVKGEPWAHVFVSTDISNKFTLSSKSSNVSYHFPLFLKESNSNVFLIKTQSREINLNPAVLQHFAAIDEIRSGEPGDLHKYARCVFNYIYAVFHSPGYRSRYAEFLKIDFPRLPLTGNLELFNSLARIGGELVTLHLLESPKLEKPITRFIGANKQVCKVGWTRDNGGTVWIDSAGKKADTHPGTSGFRGVPEDVWNFHIGGYQVCEKWLKDRKGRTLSNDDITHYQKIVVALKETIRIMAEIDAEIEKHGGWPGAFMMENRERGK